MTDEREVQAAWLCDEPNVEAATSLKRVWLMGVGRGIQIERDRATREKIDITLSKIADISPNGATAI